MRQGSIIWFVFMLACPMVIWDGMLMAAVRPTGNAEDVRPEEYPVYDLVIKSKFLTSDTTLVIIDRLTVTRVGPGEEFDTRQFFKENEFFGGGLLPDLVAEFLGMLQRPSRQRKFGFGVRYRLVSDRETGGDEVSLSPLRIAHPYTDYDGSTITLELSRVAFSPRGDQLHPPTRARQDAPLPKRWCTSVITGSDGSGAGFLVLLRGRDRLWEIVDTEVIWTVR
jgi:hypothetical protein